MADFISDDEMQKLSPDSGGDFLTDEQMAAHEAPSGSEMGTLESLGRGALDYAAPMVGAVGGGILGSGLGPVGAAGGGALGYAAGKEVGRLGSHYLFGDALPDETIPESAQRVAGNLAEGTTAELAGPIIAKGIGSATAAIPGRLRTMAEYIAEKAAAVKNPKPGTGGVLLDTGTVAPFSTKSGIRSRAAAGMEKAGSEIGDVLSQVENKVGPEDLIAEIESKIADASRLPGNEIQVRKLEKIRDNLAGRADQQFSASDLNAMKRTHADRVNYERQSTMPQSTAADSDAASIFRAKTQELADREGLGGQLSKANKTFGALASASPKENKFSGLAADAGLFAGGEAFDMLTGQHRGTGLALSAARRFGKVPAMSTTATGLNAASKFASSVNQSLPGLSRLATTGATAGAYGGQQATPEGSPQNNQRDQQMLAKYKTVLDAAKARGGNAYATTEFLLSKTDPEFQELMKKQRENE